MPKVTLSGDRLRIELSTLDKILAVHGSLDIPLEHVRAARVEDENGWKHLWRRLVGASAPGLKMAGTFVLPGGLAFLDYRDGHDCLVLDIAHERYKTVIVQLDEGADPHAVAADITGRIAAAP